MLQGAHPELIRKGIFKGVDLSVLAKRLWALQAMRADGRALPAIRYRASGRASDWVGGMAYTRSQRIILRINAPATIERAAETLLHELVHCACPMREHHGELFRRRLIACAREAFGLQLDTAALLALGPGKQGKRAYAVDEAIVEAMVAAEVSAKLREDPAVRFDAPPPETEAQVAARIEQSRAARVQARETHARQMLATWEKRAAAARRRAAGWRTKVRYYERRQLQAAKHSTGGAS